MTMSYETVTTTLEDHNPNDDPVSFTVFCLVCLVAWWFCCCYYGQRRIPPRELWRGEQIRLNAQRTWTSQNSQKERDEIPFDSRETQIQRNMRTKYVHGLNEEGNLILGNCLSMSSTSPDEEESSPSSSNDIETDEEECLNNNDEYDVDEDQACVICLEPFEVGDVVSWSKYSESCHHVFHKECIHPWFQEKRHDECPTCRSNLMIVAAVNPTSSNEPTSAATSESDDNEDDEKQYDEENPPPSQTQLPNSLETSTEDKQQMEAEDEVDDEEEDEEGSLYVIMRGMISRARTAAASRVAPDTIDYTRIDNKDSTESDETQDTQLTSQSEESQLTNGSQ